MHMNGHAGFRAASLLRRRSACIRCGRLVCRISHRRLATARCSIAITGGAGLSTFTCYSRGLLCTTSSGAGVIWLHTSGVARRGTSCGFVLGRRRRLRGHISPGCTAVCSTIAGSAGYMAAHKSASKTGTRRGPVQLYHAIPQRLGPHDVIDAEADARLQRTRYGGVFELLA